jgi:CelD/BcsL family acetyltransferase involved in cellulose biosynthesis
MRAWRSLHWIAERLAQYPDLVTTESDPRPVWDVLLRWLDEQFPDAWLELRDILPESSCAHVHGPGDEEGEQYCALPLAGMTRETLLSRVDDHMRRELRRAFRRLDDMEQLRWTYQPEADIELLHKLVALNHGRFGAASYFADEANRAFFLDVADAARDELWTATLREHETIIAMLMGYRHAGALLYVLSGLDGTRKALSPGTTVLGATILHAADEGLSTFDFLRGEERYKFEFAPEVRRSRHCTVLFRDAALRYRAANASRRALERVRRMR